MSGAPLSGAALRKGLHPAPGGNARGACVIAAGRTKEAARRKVELFQRTCKDRLGSPSRSRHGASYPWAALQQFQWALLRDLFGEHRDAPPSLDPALLFWNAGTVPKLAQAIYDEQAFDRLPVLADALEDAGCADAEILGHCRTGGEHARGCWVVDLVLGKK